MINTLYIFQNVHCIEQIYWFVREHKAINERQATRKNEREKSMNQYEVSHKKLCIAKSLFLVLMFTSYDFNFI